VLELPNVSVIHTRFPPDKHADVTSVTYSSNGLYVAVSSAKWEARVNFVQTYGFRVLDELDISEFWSQCSLVDGWFFEVFSNGWKSLELSRPRFQSGRLEWVHEYLIVGRNECVSVLTKEEPIVEGRLLSDSP
jgi:hypothetical protein